MFSFAVVKTDDEIEQRWNSRTDHFQYLSEYPIPASFMLLHQLPSG